MRNRRFPYNDRSQLSLTAFDPFWGVKRGIPKTQPQRWAEMDTTPGEPEGGESTHGGVGLWLHGGRRISFQFRVLVAQFLSPLYFFALGLNNITSRGACSPRTAVIRGAFTYAADGCITLSIITRRSISSYLTDPAEHCAGGGDA